MGTTATIWSVPCRHLLELVPRVPSRDFNLLYAVEKNPLDLFVKFRIGVFELTEHGCPDSRLWHQ